MRRLTYITWFALAALAQTLSAQLARSPTIGIDGAASVGTGTSSTVMVGLPRAGVTNSIPISPAQPSLLSLNASVAIAIDSTARESHDGEGALVGLGAGLVFAVIKVVHASRTTGRSGGPFLEPIVDPVIYGTLGASVGAVTMWLWSQR